MSLPTLLCKESEIVTTIINCARCREDHEDLKFARFQWPPKDATHWAMCPRTMEPILMVATYE